MITIWDSGLLRMQADILHLDPETAEDLAFIRNMAEKLGRPPRRREVPPEIRKRLQEACGSWSNALFQLGLSV